MRNEPIGRLVCPYCGHGHVCNPDHIGRDVLADRIPADAVPVKTYADCLDEVWQYPLKEEDVWFI